MPLRALKAPDFTRVMPAIRNAICAAPLYWTAGRMSRKFTKLLQLQQKLAVVGWIKENPPYHASPQALTSWRWNATYVATNSTIAPAMRPTACGHATARLSRNFNEAPTT